MRAGGGKSFKDVKKTESLVHYFNFIWQGSLSDQTLVLCFCMEAMSDYVDLFQMNFKQPDFKGGPVSENLRVAVVLASMGTKRTSSCEATFTFLRTRKRVLDWKSATAPLLQEYNNQAVRKGLG